MMIAGFNSTVKNFKSRAQIASRKTLKINWTSVRGKYIIGNAYRPRFACIMSSSKTKNFQRILLDFQLMTNTAPLFYQNP